MRRFILICLAVYSAAFISDLVYTIHNDGDILSALPGIVLGAPWFQIIASFVGDRMSHPELINEAIDDDYFSNIGLLTLAASGLMNAAIIFGVSRFFRKLN